MRAARSKLATGASICAPRQKPNDTWALAARTKANGPFDSKTGIRHLIATVLVGATSFTSATKRRITSPCQPLAYWSSHASIDIPRSGDTASTARPPTTRVALEGAFFAGASFAGPSFAGAFFAGPSFAGIVFAGAFFAGAFFAGIVFVGAMAHEGIRARQRLVGTFGRPAPYDAAVEREATSYRDAPTPQWPDHRGRPMPDAVYPIRPDPSIGDVLSAWSNQTSAGARPLPAKQRALVRLGLVLFAVLFAFFGGMAVMAASSWALDARLDPYLVYPTCGLAALVALVALSRPRAAVSYVGKEGIQEHFSLPLRKKDAVMRWADAHALFVREREESGSGGAYHGTSYAVTFRDREDRVLFEIAGLRHDRGMWAHESEHWDFAKAVIDRWAALRWERADAERRETGLATFRLGKRRLGIGERRLLLDDEELTPAKVSRITLGDGVLSIHREGAVEGLFRSRGIERVLAADVADLDVVLRALERWGGFRVSAG